MKHLKRLVKQITAALTRLGSEAARREAHEEVIRVASHGMYLAREIINPNTADFARHYEEWHGVPPEPMTPREDPHHAGKARMGRTAEWFLLALKVAFWVIFAPAYFSVLPWLAVVIAVLISVPLSLGIKPLLAVLILRPGLTAHLQERRLHAHVVGGSIACAVAFGGLFLLRGLGGSLALLGAVFVLPVLSTCDLVLVYLMGVAHAYTQLYGWASPFVKIHLKATAYFSMFQRYDDAVRMRLRMSDGNGHVNGVPFPNPIVTHSPASSAVALPPGPNTTMNASDPSRAAAATMILVLCLLTGGSVKAQVPRADIEVDSTSSVYPSVAERMTPIITRSFTAWTQQIGARTIRVSTFERDGWLPRSVLEIATKSTSPCTAHRSDSGIFRGMKEAAEKQAQEACDRERAAEETQIIGEVSKAIAAAWKAQPIVDSKHPQSCTAFLDLLASIALIPAENLHVIVSDTEDTCNNSANPVPSRSAGALVIIILVPSRTDLGHGVSAAARFNAKKAQLHRLAPWITAILAPAEVETYRLQLEPREDARTEKAVYSRN